MFPLFFLFADEKPDFNAQMLNFWSDPPAIIVEKTLTESSGRRRNPKSDDIRSSPDQVWFYYPYMWRNKSRGLNYAEFPWISLIIFKLISYLFSIMYILAVIARTQHLRKMVISPLFSWFVKKKIRQKTGRKFNLGKRGGGGRWGEKIKVLAM